MKVWLWQVLLHSTVAGTVCFAWARHLRLPPGESRRRILAVVLVLPLFTAAVPGRSSAAFRDHLSWFDGARMLDWSLGSGGFVVGHLVAGLGVLVATLTMVQELVPAFERPRGTTRSALTEEVERLREHPAWEGVEIAVVAEEGLQASLAGSPGRPRLLLSEDLVARLDEAELEAVVRHEQAHRRRGHWLAQHLLFAARIVQAHNPVALWVFREYCVEVEIDCDRRATEDRDPRPLVRALLEIYDDTDPADVSSRHVLRRRIDVLLGRRPEENGRLPAPTLALATSLLAVLLPWLT